MEQLTTDLQVLMKTILVIDGADNCAYDCFSAEDRLFEAIFPGDGQDIEFIEDFLKRDPNDEYDTLFAELWKRPIRKADISGIDGVLFYELEHKKEYYPNKRDSDLDGIGRMARD